MEENYGIHVELSGGRDTDFFGNRYKIYASHVLQIGEDVLATRQAAYQLLKDRLPLAHARWCTLKQMPTEVYRADLAVRILTLTAVFYAIQPRQGHNNLALEEGDAIVQEPVKVGPVYEIR
jgi:hypothetical protein